MPRKSENVILQLYARAPAPLRDYCGLTVATEELVLNIWNVTYGPHVYPKRHSCLLEDFEQDKFFQNEVLRLFGKHVLEYVTKICKGERNIENLPTKVLFRILKCLAVRDILHLSQTSKIMFERCITDNVWKIIYTKRLKAEPDSEDVFNAGGFGWKDILKQKIKKKVSKTPKKTAKASHLSSNNNFNLDTKSVNTDTSSLKHKNKSNHNNKIENVSHNLASNTNNEIKIHPSKSATVTKNTVQNNLKVNQTKSGVNLKDCVKNKLQKSPLTKPNLKNIKKTNLNFDIPMGLENSAACNNLMPNSKFIVNNVNLKTNIAATKSKNNILKK